MNDPLASAEIRNILIPLITELLDDGQIHQAWTIGSRYGALDGASYTVVKVNDHTVILVILDRNRRLVRMVRIPFRIVPRTSEE